jgi:putative ABC transport system substrate-binding protein
MVRAEHSRLGLSEGSRGSANRPSVETHARLHPRSLQIDVFSAAINRELDTAFETLVQNQADALLVNPQVLFITRRVQMVTLAARYLLPVMYWTREFVDVAGLMSYGASTTDQIRRGGIYAGRVLNGEKPADLPILQPTKFDLVINLQTARLLKKIDVPPTLLAQADAVLEWPLAAKPVAFKVMRTMRARPARAKCGSS